MISVMAINFISIWFLQILYIKALELVELNNDILCNVLKNGSKVGVKKLPHLVATHNIFVEQY